jgi:dihydrofolate reductase
MALQLSVFIATSLDGFIAREDGSIDWLQRANAVVPKGEDCGYKAFFDTIDVLVMGRNTFELALTFPEWPYGDKRVVVTSRSPVKVPEALAKSVSGSSESPKAIADRLSKDGVKRAYIDGGITIQRFLNDGLIDDLTITRVPVLIGRGLPLFGPLAGDVELEHVSTKSWEFGFVQSVYRATRATAIR